MKQIHLDELGEMIVGVDTNGNSMNQIEMDAAEARADLAAHGD